MTENPVKTVPPRTADLEIKDAHLIFDGVWNELVNERGLENLRFPREIFWLNGAPGAGKGTQTRFIMEYKGLTAAPVIISDLLTSPDAYRLKEAGMMVGDREVTGLLLRALLLPQNRSGVVVDGFPRTKVQVECLKLFHNKLQELRQTFLHTPNEEHFQKPIFHIIVLYIDEQISVQRQLLRGRRIQEAKMKGETDAEGNPIKEEVRRTDLDPDAARGRYRTFKEVTYPSLATLRELFHYHFINAAVPIENVQARIVEELKYQSTLELDQSTNDIIARIPVASHLIEHARQKLVRRLDDYALHHRELFTEVVDLIARKFVPIVERHAISGLAYINTEESLFDHPIALAMAIDIFSERGYHAVVDVRKKEIPHCFDVKTGVIQTRRVKVYRFRINFEGSNIRRGR